jgi:hypothetical protein
MKVTGWLAQTSGLPIFNGKVSHNRMRKTAMKRTNLVIFLCTAGSLALIVPRITIAGAISGNVDFWGDSDEILPVDMDFHARFADMPAIVDTGNGTAPIIDMGAFEAFPSPLIFKDSFE